MARSRNIKPGFFTNDSLCELPPLTRLLFAGLWTIADREGRIEDRPKKIRAEVLPYDACDVDAMLTELATAGFVSRYSAKGRDVIQVSAWAKHQNPHVKESASNLPAPDENSASTGQAPDSTQPLPERAGLIPSSLIPDSLVPQEPGKVSAGALASMAMKKAGMPGVSPSHPTLLALLEGGITVDELADAAREAVAKEKPFAYALSIAQGRRKDAARVSVQPKPMSEADRLQARGERQQ